jgi:phospholipid-binding lipoprotein MlaA
VKPSQTAVGAGAHGGWMDRDHRARRSLVRRGVAVALAAFLASSCATTGTGPAVMPDVDQDPLEPFNRAMFEVNLFLDELLIKPAAILYRLTVPDPLRAGITNALFNLGSPITFANDLLQGNFDRAGTTLSRFAVNSTVGLLGFIDVGSRLGLAYHYEDFGQTLAVYGVPSGPYIMLPLLGPSTPRDAAARIVDFFFTPVTYVAPTEAHVGLTGAQAVDLREQTIEAMEELERTSLDFYVAVRTSFVQYRAAEIRNGAPPIEDLYEDIYDLDDPFADPAELDVDPAEE